jgi:hypothetical protein
MVKLKISKVAPGVEMKRDILWRVKRRRARKTHKDTDNFLVTV